jgi:hypothetical protein
MFQRHYAPASRTPRATTRLTAHLALSALASAFFLAAPIAFAANKSAPPAKPATEYPAHETHDDEHFTVAIDPCLAPKDCSFFRVPYVENGFLPVRVIFTNDSDHAVSLDDARIQFIPVDGGKIQAATDEDLDRRVYTVHNPSSHIPIVPIPIPIHKTPVDKKITQDETDFGFSGTVVNAHSTLAGYLFYDIRGLDEPLKGAELYVKMLHTLDGKKDLFSFSVPFNKWLAAKPDPSSH